MFKKYIVFLMLFLTGCAHQGIYMNECKSLCQNQKVKIYKDETIVCKCNTDPLAGLGDNDE